MGNSLQDQLLKAGLVDKQKLQKAEKQKRAHQKQARKGKGKGQPDPRAAQQRQQAAEARERDRELNRKREEKARHKAQQAEIRQLIEDNRLTEVEGDIPFNFQLQDKIKRMYLTQPARDRVLGGKLAIALLNGRYELVPREIGEKIAERNPKRVVLFEAEKPAEKSAEDDPYAGFEVPDDLMW